MKSKQFAINAILCLLCAAAWFGLPNSVFNQNYSTLSKIIIGILTLAGGWGLYNIVKSIRKQNNS